MVESLWKNLANVTIPLHCLQVLALKESGDRHKLQLDLQSLLDASTEQAQYVFADFSGNHGLGAICRGIRGG